MAWRRKDPRTFPARFPSAMREAVAALTTPILFGSYNHRSQADADAETFRYYRWCIRENPDVDKTLSGYFSLYNFRTIIIQEDFGVQALYLTAKPTPVSDLIELNPHLRELI